MAVAEAKTLVVCHKQLGDTLLLQPVLAKISAYDGMPVDFYTHPRHTQLLELMPEANLVKDPRRRRYASLWCYEPGSKSIRGAVLARANNKTLLIAAAKHRRWYYRMIFDRILERGRRFQYRARYYWDHTEVPGAADYAPPRLLPPPSTWCPGHFEATGYLLLNPVSAWPKKSGVPARWSSLIQALCDRGIGPVVLVGGQTSWQLDYCREMLADLHVPVVNLSGRTTLPELIHLIAYARLVLSVDGAIAHLAQAYRRPCITMFGPTDARHWHYDGPLSIALSARDYLEEKRPSLDALPNEVVLAAVQQLWSELK